MLVGMALALLIQVPQPLEPAPGTDYDPAIPTLQSVAGHGFGQEVTPPSDIVRYMEALAGAAPDRTRLIHYADTWEGRPLYFLAIAGPRNMGRIDQVKAGLARLADPRGLSDDDGQALVADLPVVVALIHGVHGNEISSSGAAMAHAYHLLAARNDPRVDAILENAVVLIDPAENPDGRARFVLHTRAGRGAVPDADPRSAEHDEPWPGGRTNHYMFDMNRDWFLQSQPETRGRVRAFLEWYPQVVADLHEMGGNSTYYFPPPAVPVSPWVTEAQHQGWELMGRSMAGAFDARGFAYFVKENFDAFYPGYGDSWPGAHGAVAMTFEQASARGLVFDRTDGDQLTYNRGVVQHFTAALTTAHTAAANRERLLGDYLAFRRSALEVSDGVGAYALHSAHDPAMARRLAQLLADNGIEVSRADAAVSAGGRTLPAGSTWLVSLAQPASRLVRSLLDPDVEMDPDFLARQVDRLANRLDHEMYDVTAWSLPLLFDVDAVAMGSMPGVDTTPLSPTPGTGPAGRGQPAPETPPALPDAQVAWVMPWGTATAAAAAQAEREGIDVRVAGAPFTLEGRAYPIGTAFVRSAEVDAAGRQALARIVVEHGAEVVAANTGYVDDGISLGSGRVRAMKAPRVVVAWDEPTRSYSAGWVRYVLERRYGQPVTAIRAATLTRAPLSDYDVIILPSGSYGDVFGDAFMGRLRDWMRQGGTLVTLAGSSAWAVREGLLETQTELRGGAPADGGEGGNGNGRDRNGAAPEQPVDFLEAIQPERESPIVIPGGVLNGTLDTDHWLSSGTDGQIGVLVEGTRVFSPMTLDNGVNVGRYAEGDALVASGVVWDESRSQLMNKPFLMHQPMGQGHLVAFAEDPNYRAYTEATILLFVNAVLLGPAF